MSPTNPALLHEKLMQPQQSLAVNLQKDDRVTLQFGYFIFGISEDACLLAEHVLAGSNGSIVEAFKL